MNRYRIKPQWVVLIVVLFFSPLLLAQSLWLDPQASYKNTQCTQSQPCRRLGLAADLANPGDEIVLKDGQYDFGHIDSVNGTLADPIVIRAQNPLQAVLKAREFEGPRDLLEISNSQHIRVQGLRFRHAARASVRINNSQFIDIVGNQMLDSGVWGIFTNHSNDLQLLNNQIIGKSRQHGIYLSNSGDRAVIANNLIQGARGCGIQLNGDLRFGGGRFVQGDGIISEIEIRDNQIQNVGSAGGAAINLDGARDVVIENNSISEARAAGIAMFKTDGAIASRNISITSNSIAMAEKSRSAIVVMHSLGPIDIANNSIQVNDKHAFIFDVNAAAYEAKKGWRRYWQAWFGKPELKALVIGDNNFKHQASFARFDQVEFISLDAWQTILPE